MTDATKTVTPAAKAHADAIPDNLTLGIPSWAIVAAIVGGIVIGLVIAGIVGERQARMVAAEDAADGG